MTYTEAVDFLYTKLPFFQNQGQKAFNKSLNKTNALCKHLGNPQNGFKSVHIAGTNGKGSTAHMLASVLQTAGYKTGLYTSPHLKSFTERIRINGEEIGEKQVVDFLEDNMSFVTEHEPTFFELTTGLAFQYFAEQKVDIAIIETGLGGRLDCTNVLSPELCIITPIGMDHEGILGDTLKEIAVEKAGIIKPETPLIISDGNEELSPVFKDIAWLLDCSLVFAQKEEWGSYETDLMGNYQKYNIKGVLAAINTLNEKGYSISEENISNGLGNVQKRTGLKGRWQILRNDPMVICDTGHNYDAIKTLIDQLTTIVHNKLHMVWGMADDKDPEKILELLPETAEYYLCKPDIPRARDTDELSDHFAEKGLNHRTYNSVMEAYRATLNSAGESDLIFIGGSTFVVAEIDEL